jgi:hypothetical protein
MVIALPVYPIPSGGIGGEGGQDGVATDYLPITGVFCLTVLSSCNANTRHKLLWPRKAR